MEYLRFKFYGKTLKYRNTFAIITKDFYRNFPIYEMETSYMQAVSIDIPKREGLYIVVFGRNDRKVIFCIKNIFYIYHNYSEPLWADTEKYINPIIYIKDCLLSDKGREKKRYEMQFKELIEYNQRLVYKADLRQRLMFMKRKKALLLKKVR